MHRLAVLGGSSPFTAALVDAFAAAKPAVEPHALVLQGRSEADLDAVARYASNRLACLGWTVDRGTDAEAVLRDARIVVHQNRYGGLDGRARDEAFATRFGIPPDETLGPAALHSILRVAPEIRRAGELLAKSCPDAWVLNLTNPLSVATLLMAGSGVERCVGVCELPSVTARRAAGTLGLDLENVDWRYAGLNHRGFVVRLSLGTRDLIDELIQSLGKNDFEGVAAADIAAIHAIPTKYFRLLRGGTTEEGRGRRVAAVRERIRAELSARPDTSPPSLRQRYMEWYAQGVVPLVAALRSEDPHTLIVNQADDDGICRELHARVSASGIEPLPRPALSPGVARWIGCYELHERALARLAWEPNMAGLRRVLEADPLVPATSVDPILREAGKLLP